MKYLVTGATGFIGRQVCRQVLADGCGLLPLSRSGEKLSGGEATLAVDLSCESVDPQLLQGVDVVIHLAGIAHRRATSAQYLQLNEQAPLILARQALAAGVPCFIYVSSVKAMGNAQDSTARRSEEDCQLPVEAYGLSKWRAECSLRELLGGRDMSLAIVRPALVYGPAARGNLELLARAVRLGLPRPPAGGARSMIDIDDLVDLLRQLASRPLAGAHTWIACGERDYSTREIYDLLRLACGKTRVKTWLPAWAWHAAAATLDRLGGGDDSLADKLFGTELYSSRAVQEATGWRPVRDIETSIGRWGEVLRSS